MRQLMKTMIAMMGLLVGAVSAAVAQGEPSPCFIVSPTGNDANDGLEERTPFATLERARDAIRAERQRRAGPPPPAWAPDAPRDANPAKDAGPAVVMLVPGRYERTAPFELTKEDYHTTYQPLLPNEGGDVIITGGFLIKDWKDAGNGAWVAEVPGLKEGTVYFEQLFVNGNRAVRARWPKTQTDWKFAEVRKDFLNPAAVKQVLTTNENKSVRIDQYLTAREGDLDVLAKVPKEELKYAALVVHHNWDTTRRMILDYNAETRTISAVGGIWKHWNPWRTNSLYYVENVRSAFTDPGEWFLAKDEGKVYYRPRPGEDMKTATIEAPRNGVVQLLVMKGCDMISFQDIQFSVSDTPRRVREMNNGDLRKVMGDDLLTPGPTQFEPCQAAGNTEALILVDDTTRSGFSSCVIKNTGEYGIWIRSNCHDNSIAACTIEDTGAGSIRLSDFPKNKKPSMSNYIQNNTITRGGRFHASSTAIWIGEGKDNYVCANHISDHYYTGISIGWEWGYRGESFNNTITDNLVENLGQGALGDMGGFYSLGTQTGTRVANNVFRNVWSYTYGGWGIYPDEGSEGLVIENNLAYNVKDGGFHQHYGKENIVRNNIFAFSVADQIAVTRIEAHTSVRFTGNIIYWDKPTEVFDRYRTMNVTNTWEKNIWWCEAGAPTFKGKTFVEWQGMGRDVEGFVIDPLFVDPAKRDFRFKSDATYKKIGFVPFDFSQAGMRK